MTATTTTPVAKTPNWHQLLEEAVYEPGRLSETRKFFRQYSLTNRWLASSQLHALGVPLAPINTYKGWLALGRNVMKGQKASVALVMPITIKKKKEEGEVEDDKKGGFTTFMLRQNWFHLGQTEGEDYAPVAAEDSDWLMDSAFTQQGFTRAEFAFKGVSDFRDSYSDAKAKTYAVNPLCKTPTVAMVRELAHIYLGHYDEKPSKAVPTEVSLQDLETEATVYLVMGSVGLPDMDIARGTLQARMDAVGLENLPNKQINRAFGAADKIINAGYC